MPYFTWQRPRKDRTYWPCSNNCQTPQPRSQFNQTVSGRWKNSEMYCSARSVTSESSPKDPRNVTVGIEQKAGLCIQETPNNYWQRWTAPATLAAYRPACRATQGTSTEYSHTFCITHGITIRSRRGKLHSEVVKLFKISLLLTSSSYTQYVI